MGGCRCSYRSCKVRSDGQTHMFHFPVFNKMRCHQWITNSLKPNFLNLKLSQLKNRVVCQHHFKDDQFMNYMKHKLKSDAVPTEDGPYCVSDPTQTVNMEDNDLPTIPISADDIENETLNCLEKKAHSSVKYGDFLISDVTELFNSSHNGIDNKTSQKVFSKRLNNVKNATYLLNEGNTLNGKHEFINPEENHQYTIIYSNDEETKANIFNSNKSPKIVAIDYEETSNSIPKTLNKMDQQEVNNLNTPVFNIINKPVPTINPDKVVKILSEKTISEPLVIEGKLEPMSPSMTIRRNLRKVPNNVVYDQRNWDVKPQLKEEISTNTSFKASNNNVIILQDQTVLTEQIIPIEYAPTDLKLMYKDNENVQGVNMNVEKTKELLNLNNSQNQNNINDVQKQNPLSIEQEFLNSMLQTAEKMIEPNIVKTLEPKPFKTPRSSASKSLLKSKITPEKLAVIEQKRKFNLKLRDVISTCLDNLDDHSHSEVIEKKTSQEKGRTLKRILRSEAPGLQSSPSNMISYLDARLQRMEDTLLSKIDHNTQRINELKRTIKPSSNARHANTQTYLNHMTDQSQKQYLYKEISKFLSPDANIKIYDELFSDNTLQSDNEFSTLRKLRKRR